MASQRAVFSASSLRMDTAHQPAVITASWNLATFSAQNSTSGGSSETEVNALTVIACPVRVATTTMPLANWPAARRVDASWVDTGWVDAARVDVAHLGRTRVSEARTTPPTAHSVPPYRYHLPAGELAMITLPLATGMDSTNEAAIQP